MFADFVIYISFEIYIYEKANQLVSGLYIALLVLYV